MSNCTIQTSGGSGGPSSNSFETINAPNGTDPVADSPTDTLNLTSSNNSVTITGDSTTDTVDFIADRGTFVFRPGVTPVQNVYDTWAILYADLIRIQGTRTVIIDDNFGTCTVPAGTYNLADCVFSAVLTSASQVILNFDIGAVLSSLPTEISNGLFFTSNSTSPVYTTPGGGVQVAFLMNLSAHLEASNGAPFIDIVGGDEFILFLTDQAEVGSGSYEAIRMSGSSFLIVLCGDITTFNNNQVRDDGTCTIFFLYAAVNATASSFQANFTGGIISQNTAAATLIYTNGIATDFAVGTVQDGLDNIGESGMNRYNLYGAATNTLAAETDLFSKVMPTSDLRVQYDCYRIRAGGSFAANANAKRVRLYFGATVIADTGSIVLNNGRWQIEATVYFNTNTTQVAISFGHTTLAALVSFGSRTAPGETLSNSITIKSTGLGAATADIQQDFFDIMRIGGYT